MAHSDSATLACGKPTKRQRKVPDNDDDDDAGFIKAQHPNNVQPLGNSFADPHGLIRRRLGAGDLGCLPDDVLIDVMKWLTPRDLCRLAPVSPFLYVVTNHDDLWKTVALRDREFLSQFDVNWKQTFLTVSGIGVRLRPLRFQSIYSDVLFQPWLNSTLEISPNWLSKSNIDRRSAKELTVSQFIELYEKPRIPVIITDLVTNWPAFGKWSWEYLSQVFGDVPLNVQVVDMTLGAYWSYARQTTDETALYLFEKDFVNKFPSLELDFEVPAYFSEDLFQLLGSDRPDYRWIIAGPERSGSTFHQDPNATSAWNAVLTGSKKWILFPKHVCPPGVVPSEDGGEVMTPLSLVEWFSSYYMDAEKLNPYEGIVNAGELMFVPSGMWHSVLNLESSIAVTQNYVSPRNLLDVLKFARETPDLVSGYKSSVPLTDVLRRQIDEQYPGLIASLEIRDNDPRSVWSSVTEESGEKFRFSFSDTD